MAVKEIKTLILKRGCRKGVRGKLLGVTLIAFMVGCRSNSDQLLTPADPDTSIADQASLKQRLQSAQENPIHFRDIQEHVLAPACLSCHGTESAESELKFDKYESLRLSHRVRWVRPFEPEQSPFYYSLQTPVDETEEAHAIVSFEQKELVRLWINQGARNAEGVSASPSSSHSVQLADYLQSARRVEFSKVQEWVFRDGRCTECHSQDGWQSDRFAILFGVNLSAYDTLFNLFGIVPGQLIDGESEGEFHPGSQVFMSVIGEEPSMPPARLGYPRLSSDQVELLRRWIIQGARQ